MSDYYEILNVKRDASNEEVKRAFSWSMLQLHQNMENQRWSEEFQNKMNQIFKAFLVLRDSRSRRLYDQSFLECTLEELYTGCIKKMKVVRTVPVSKSRWLWSVIMGRRSAAARKLKSMEEILEIEIKPGWKKGRKIRVTAKGNQNLGVAPTDINLVVAERPHAVFKRVDNDLVVIHKISLLDSLAANTINFTTLDGRDIRIEVDNIVKPGDEFVFANEGMPITNEPGKKGNLIIKFVVVFPSRLTTQQKSDLQKILSTDANNY